MTLLQSVRDEWARVRSKLAAFDETVMAANPVTIPPWMDRSLTPALRIHVRQLGETLAELNKAVDAGLEQGSPEVDDLIARLAEVEEELVAIIDEISAESMPEVDRGEDEDEFPGRAPMGARPSVAEELRRAYDEFIRGAWDGQEDDYYKHLEAIIEEAGGKPGKPSQLQDAARDAWEAQDSYIAAYRKQRQLTPNLFGPISVMSTAANIGSRLTNNPGRECPRVQAHFERLHREVRNSYPTADIVFRVDPAAGDGGERQFAYCSHDGDSPVTIAFAPKAESLSDRQIRGLLLHEFGHALDFLGLASIEEERLHPEPRADAIAARVFGMPVEYGDDTVQCVDCGGTDRPAALDAPLDRRVEVHVDEEGGLYLREPGRRGDFIPADMAVLEDCRPIPQGLVGTLRAVDDDCDAWVERYEDRHGAGWEEASGDRMLIAGEAQRSAAAAFFDEDGLWLFDPRA